MKITTTNSSQHRLGKMELWCQAIVLHLSYFVCTMHRLSYPQAKRLILLFLSTYALRVIKPGFDLCRQSFLELIFHHLHFQILRRRGLFFLSNASCEPCKELP